MKSKKAARDCCNNQRAKSSTLNHKRDVHSISESEYERGTRIAGWMLCAMLAFMAVWVVVCGW